jgi:hypothetical protein
VLGTVAPEKCQAPEIEKIAGAPKPQRGMELRRYAVLQNAREKWSFKDIWSSN